MLYGLYRLSPLGYVLVTLLLAHLSMMCVTLFLHRCQSHRGVKFHPLVSHMMRFWLWLTTGIVTRFWVAIHRKHHAKCDEEEDPHSPQQLGLKCIFLGGLKFFRRPSPPTEKLQATLERYGHGTPDDWVERNIYTRHYRKGVCILLGVYGLLLGVPGLGVWFVQIAWTLFFANGAINGIGHYWGYRNFETPNAARNVLPLGLLIGGEELHNNHHTFSSSPRFSVKWWEFDVGWLYIRILQALGLAKVKRLAPQLQKNPHKLQIDVDTLRVLVANRFRVMAAYRKRVLLPVFREERGRLGKAEHAVFQRKSWRLLGREHSLINTREEQQLQKLLATAGQKLRTVYQFRIQLQEIWEKATRCKDLSAVRQVQEWCQQAEETGIEVLREFARQVRTYTCHP